MPSSDVKRDLFRRLAAKRTNTVIERVRILGNCSNRSLYEFTDEDIKKIFSAIEAQLKETKAKFQVSRKRRIQL